MINIIDTETASLKGGVCEIARLTLDDNFNIIRQDETLVNPECRISNEAAGIHFIRDDMVEDKPTLAEVLPTFLPTEGYIVAHNASFDIRSIGGEDVIPEGVKILCTLELARELYHKNTVGNHKLGTLYHYFECYKRMKFEGQAHSAGFDCAMLALVLESLLTENNLTMDEAWDLINKPIEETLCYTKKYRDQKLTWKEVFTIDESYCRWIAEKADLKYIKKGEEVKVWIESIE